MELQTNEEVTSTTRYWGYRELTAAELLHVSGGDDSDHDSDTGSDTAGSNYDGAYDSGVGAGYTVASNPMGDNFLGGLGVEGGGFSFGGGRRGFGGATATVGIRG